MQVKGMIIKSDSGKEYRITLHPPINGKPVIYCSCNAWRFQALPVEDRTCKHIEFAGEAVKGAARVLIPS